MASFQQSFQSILNIPNLMVKILSNLDLPEQINCRLVSKYFKDVIDNGIDRQELIINGYKGYRGCIINTKDYCNGFYRLRSTNYKNSFRPLDEEHRYFSSSSSFKKLFAHLKELHLNAFFNSNFNLEVLNQFTKIIRLFIYIIPVNKRQVLDLPNLKELAILGDDSLEVVQGGTIIRSKVEKLTFNARPYPFKFEHPETVLELKFHWPCDLAAFKNVKILRLLDIFLCPRYLESLENLEEVYLGEEFSTYSFHDFTIPTNLRKIKRIHVCGVLIYEFGKTTNLDSASSMQTCQMLNYRILSNDVSTIYLDYSELMDDLDRYKDRFINLEKDKLVTRLPADFFNKFTDLRYIAVTKLDDEMEFLNFLSKCKFLNILWFEHLSISQSFLDQLPSVCDKSLNILKIYKVRNRNHNNDLDFHFISKLKFIWEFYTDCIIPDFCFAEDSFRQCRYLIRLEFSISKETVLCIRENNKFKVRASKNELIYELDKEEFLSGKFFELLANFFF